MSNYTAQLKAIVEDLVDAKQPFSFEKVKKSLEKILENSGKYIDPIKMKELRLQLLTLYEEGQMPTYALMSKPMVGDDGPYFTLEFSPENPMAILDLIDKPESNGQRVSCTIHLYYKDMIRDVASMAECNQDTLVRSILIKSLNMISDQLK